MIDTIKLLARPVDMALLRFVSVVLLTIHLPCSALDIGDKAPEFCMTDLNAKETIVVDGVTVPMTKKFCLKEYVGPSAKNGTKTILLSFFATWCLPCVKELPYLQSLQHANKNKGLTTIIVNVDQEHEDKLKAFLLEKAIELPVIKDVYKILLNRYEVAELPNILLIDAAGIIRRRHLGFGEEDKRTIELELSDMLDRMTRTR